ncbi:beta-ketoacyl synthase chain length factor [Actinosynnema sp. NPDC047251]|uniref:Putative ketosynthase n=1 Tax=Saccharothrix espanaensis (strain ATCC 51144 / DSM 44229 / JCM 9112 / NBRC 15066 / NRRL 15764) TaxID=1179773 RepID=K0JXI4_SACES|nr:beta-ketoacyl synthase chain length factor [Saccharothrix espanaensis]CCH29454.1 putative ketosynthase [Saccharothrix espanaensis DSM 44229]
MTTSDLPRAVVGAACLAPWGERARDVPGAAPVDLTSVPGFVTSRFNPLVAAVAEQCLGAPGGDLIHGLGERTAIVLATACGDTTTSDLATRKLVAGQVHSPLLFFQSVTTSILGHLARQYGITGPVSCVSACEDLAGSALRLADLLLFDDELEQVLVIGVELAPNDRVTWVRDRLGAEHPLGRLPLGEDAAVALLLRRATRGRPAVPADPPHPAYGWLGQLVGLCTAAAHPDTSTTD